MSDEVYPDYKNNPRVIAANERLRSVVEGAGLKWHDPHLGPGLEMDDVNDVDFGWTRIKNTLYLGLRPDDDDLHYLKVWGPNMHTQMSESKNPSDAYFIEIWKWLWRN